MGFTRFDTFEDRTIANAIRHQAETIGDSTWLMFDDVHYTFGEVNEASNRYAAGLLKSGVNTGDSVAVFMPNCPEYVFLTLAMAKIGVLQVPINTAFKGEFLRRQLDHSMVKAVVVDGSLIERLEAVIPDRVDTLFVRRSGAIDPPPGTQYVDLAEFDIHSAAEPGVPVDARSVMSVLYTSGTTGASKGAMMSHHYWYSATEAIIAARDVRDNDVFHASLPMFHAGVWLYTIYSSLLSGRPTGLDNTFSVSTYWDRIAYYRATQLYTAGAMHMFIWGAPERPDDASNTGRVWVAVPLPPEIWDPFKKRFGIDHLVFQYGQTEVVPVTVGAVGTTIKPGSAGRALPHFDVAILDDYDNPVAPDTPGEICVRPKAPNTMFEGYFRNPEATVAAFRNLWHHTGDLGRMDADGELFFLDRKQDYLRRRGENISSFEVEAAVLNHEAVQAVAAHAIPSEATEDEVKICVVLHPGATLSHEELARFCNDNLPYFAVPRYIEFLDELPVTEATVRTQKYKLRERGVTETTWDAEKAGFGVVR